MTAETEVQAQAWSVPTEAYLSPEYARAERDAIWRKVWQVACREEEIEKPGDFVTYDILDDSIIVTRQDDGSIKAYHNVCPHRSAPASSRLSRNRSVCPVPHR